MVGNEMRVKGTRSGHINHAPEDIQNKYNQAKELLADCLWVNDGVDYCAGVIAKKVAVKEAELETA